MQFYCKPNQFLIQIEKGKIISKKIRKGPRASQPAQAGKPA
jgi:hypothetical protein